MNSMSAARPRATNPHPSAIADGERREGARNDPGSLKRPGPPGVAGGGRLPLRQPVHLVVVDEHGDVGVAPDVVDEVVPPLAVDVAVAAGHHDGERRIGHPDRQRGGQGAAVETVEDVDVHVVRQFRRLSDPGDQDDLVLRLPRPLQRFFHRVQDREVAAPGAPGVLHVRVEDSAHRRSFTRSATSPGVNGSPSNRAIVPETSRPVSARIRRASCPVRLFSTVSAVR